MENWLLLLVHTRVSIFKALVSLSREKRRMSSERSTIESKSKNSSLAMTNWQLSHVWYLKRRCFYTKLRILRKSLSARGCVIDLIKYIPGNNLTLNVDMTVARFTRKVVKWDFFEDFNTLWPYSKLLSARGCVIDLTTKYVPGMDEFCSLRSPLL